MHAAQACGEEATGEARVERARVRKDDAFRRRAVRGDARTLGDEPGDVRVDLCPSCLDRLAEVLEAPRLVDAPSLLLGKETLEGVLGIAGRYKIPVFVATRGQLARRVIKERRPRAVVAVACERDMVSGLHDVAGRVPVLGLTLTLPSGPCKDTRLDLVRLEEWVKAYVA